MVSARALAGVHSQRHRRKPWTCAHLIRGRRRPACRGARDGADCSGHTDRSDPDQSHVINMPPDVLSSGEHFALEVRGDSMIDAGILDGDIAVIKRVDGAETGDIVVALIDDEEATLKRFRRRGARSRLSPPMALMKVRFSLLTASASKGKWWHSSGGIDLGRLISGLQVVDAGRRITHLARSVRLGRISCPGKVALRIVRPRPSVCCRTRSRNFEMVADAPQGQSPGDLRGGRW